MGLHGPFPLTLSKIAMGFPIHIAQNLLHYVVRQALDKRLGMTCIEHVGGS
jgi:hypothetical protein